MEEVHSDEVQKKRKVKIVIFCIVGGLLLLALTGVIAWNAILDSMIGRVDESRSTLSSEELASMLEETDPEDPSFTGPVLKPEEIPVATLPAPTVPTGKNVLNFLVVGQDAREGQGRQRSDAMILCTLNFEEKTLTMTSFLRDVWVKIPGYYNERLNVPYAVGGFPLLNETLEYNFGVSADHNIEVDFNGFAEVVDFMGGVEIELTDAEAKHLNKYGNHWGRIDGHHSWNLEGGKRNLTGLQALAYSRIRALDNDFGRTNRQRTVMDALLKKVKTMSFYDVTVLAANVLPMISTDMTNQDITTCIARIMPIIRDLKVVSQRVPVDGSYSFASIGGRSVILLDDSDLEVNRKLLADAVCDE